MKGEDEEEESSEGGRGKERKDARVNPPFVALFFLFSFILIQPLFSF